MLEKEYDLLVHYIEGMVADGVQLVHGGRLIDWSDTNVLDQIARIKELKEGFESPDLHPGDRLKNKVSGQDMWVINTNDKTVYLLPDGKIVEYPLDKLMEEFVLVEKSKKYQF